MTKIRGVNPNRRLKRTLKIFFLLLVGCALSGRVCEAVAEESGADVGAFLFSLYRDHVTAVDGDRCPSYPSCASYSTQAFKKHGFLVGWVMTVDRLIHEGKEELSVSPVVYVGGGAKIFDPVENNDFWWFKEDDRAGRK